MKGKLLLIAGLFCVATAFSQNYQTVVARKGDGIFSLLRGHGLNPVKYYGQFIELNADKLADGSELKLGETYRIPVILKDLDIKARLVRIGDSLEYPLLDNRLTDIAIQSDQLEDAIVYLISGYHPNALSPEVWQQARELNLTIAEELVEHGAQVYMIEPPQDSLPRLEEVAPSVWVLDEDRTELSVAPTELMAQYVEEINRRYLMNLGAYQRVILTRLDGPIKGNNCQIAVMHYRENKDSKLVARRLRDLFRQEKMHQGARDQVTTFFKNPSNLYLGRNVMAPVTLIEFSTQPGSAPENSVRFTTDRKLFSSVIANGLREDYARILFEDE